MAAASATAARAHGDVAARTLHWYDDASASWLSWQAPSSSTAAAEAGEVAGGSWEGWGAADAEPRRLLPRARDGDGDGGEEGQKGGGGGRAAGRLWSADLDASGAPFYRWFVGGRTNAAFNEVDRHVLGGRGGVTAFILEPPTATARAAAPASQGGGAAQAPGNHGGAGRCRCVHVAGRRGRWFCCAAVAS
jgi:acrylyl-CoA reductase (NADPH)/3-hydroxypropionyl-CoA dehydratase/3-hydroxypropionyl-CoA synthetase